jgi:pilus assembly protein FimV
VAKPMMLCLLAESEFSEGVRMRAKPILSLTLIASALAISGSASALGLGRLTVQSSLGQPLSATIELTSAQKEELDSLAAKVADPSLYRQNNLAYLGVLARARIAVERTPDGQAYLKITTPGAVNEPYLDLLVEINWASGRVVRDYTFLLDPPGTGVPVVPVEPMTPARAGAAAPRAAAASTARGPEPKAAPGEGYTVKRGDTLSKIATEYKPQSVTLEQMLVALFKRNEGAFDGSNMNRLRAGAIVTIPQADEVGATPATEAAKVVRMQASDWRTYRDQVAGAAPAAEGAAGRAAAGKIGTVVEEKTPAPPPAGDQLKVSREAGQGKGGVAEDVVARDKALKDAQQRISELEKTLKDLQRAVELKSQPLAQLQTQAEAGKARPAEPPKAAAPVAPLPTPAAKAPEPPKAEAPKAVPTPPVPAPIAKAPEPAKVEPPKAEPPKAEPPKVEPPKAAEAAKVEPPKAAEPSKATVAKAPAKQAEPPSFVDDLMSNTPTWAIGAGALAVLGGIAALIAARRRKTTKFEDSIISGTDIKTNTVFGSTGGGVVNTGDNSLASDFSREGLGNIDTDEVDPIAEAEVYLAYGRDAQAEEILKDALKKDPQRQEVYLKLLEIHAQHNKPSAFETVAAELYAVSKGQGEVWQKAVGLGRQLDPNNPMFGESGSAAAAAAVTAAAAGAAVASTEAESHAVRPEIAPEAPRAAATAADEGLDFKLDEEISVSPTSGVKPKSPVDILAGAESELEKTAKGTTTATMSALEAAGDRAKATAAGIAGAAAAGTMAMGTSGFEHVSTALSETVDTAKAEAPKFDLDFHLDGEEKPAPLQSAAKIPELAEVADAAPSLARPQAAIELDKLDLSFDPDRTTFEDPTPSVLDGQWHDAATKLDLAKAYQEMGDVEGAREILQEVLHEGDDQQKAEAHSLMAKLT